MSCYAFVKENRVLLEDSAAVLNVAWLSDKAHFHFDYYVNKQNILFWVSENPRPAVANPLHPERVKLWYALLNVGIFGPMISYSTVSSDVYFCLQNDDFFPFPEGLWHSDEFTLVSAGLVPDLIPAVLYFAFFVLF